MPPVSATELSPRVSARILLVEDDPGLLESLRELFLQKGFVPDTASTGRQALALMERQSYHVGVFDINLPDLPGTDLLTAARERHPDMKCIIATGDTSVELAVRAVEEGAFHYLRKPIEFPYLEAVVRQALKEQQLEWERREFAEFVRSLVECLELDARLRLVAQSLVRATGLSRCLIWLCEERSLKPVFALPPHQGPNGGSAEGVSFDELPRALRDAMTSGRLIPDAAPRTAGPLGAAVSDCRTVTWIPLVQAGRPIGLAALCDPERSCFASEREVEHIQTMAYIAAVAIDQARTVAQERETLHALAKTFLSDLPARPDVELAARFGFAVETALVGGDYYDVIEFDDHRIGIVIGDVCGKGLAAADYTAKAKYMLAAYASENMEDNPEQPSPAWVLKRLNRALYTRMSDEAMYVTMVFGILDTRSGTFTYTNAGHPPPLLYHAGSGRLQTLDATGGMVGAIEEMQFSERTVRFEPGSVLVLFTDGVTEARRDHRFLGVEGVEEVLLRHASENAQAIADAIYERANEFAGGALRDDVAIVVVRNRGGV